FDQARNDKRASADHFLPDLRATRPAPELHDPREPMRIYDGLQLRALFAVADDHHLEFVARGGHHRRSLDENVLPLQATEPPDTEEPRRFARCLILRVVKVVFQSTAYQLDLVPIDAIAPAIELSAPEITHGCNERRVAYLGPQAEEFRP